MADVEQKVESAAEAGKEQADPKEKAFTHLAQGKRHLLVKDYAEAVASLAVASELLARVYGEAADECGDAYFNYGRALLGLAREEAGVLGDAVEEEPEDSEEGDEEEGEAPANKEDAEMKADEEGKQQQEEEENGKGDSEEEEDDADTVSNLKLAWEMLELVKIIFQRQADKDEQVSLKLAEVYMYLGEIGLESVNYETAIEDMNRCLEIRRQRLPGDDRRVAETLYQLGLAHSLASNFDDSVKCFSEALAVLELRVANLEKRKESGGDCSEELRTDAFYTLDGEIAELEALLPEVKEKIADMEDSKRETLKALFEKRCGDMQQGAGASSSSSSSSAAPAAEAPVPSAEPKPVSDISHLIRKKRKLEPESTDEAKKSKKEETAAAGE